MEVGVKEEEEGEEEQIHDENEELCKDMIGRP